MIKAQDLRLGNWVKTTHNDFWEEHFRGVAVKMELYLLDNLITTGLDLFEPIELTPELLGKINGFSPSSIGYHIIVKNEDGVLVKLYIELTPTGNEFTCFKRFMRADIEFRLDWEIKYLHQLQNVVYFFTGGMELEITL